MRLSQTTSVALVSGLVLFLSFVGLLTNSLVGQDRAPQGRLRVTPPAIATWVARSITISIQSSRSDAATAGSSTTSGPP